MSLQELYCELVDSKFRMNFYQAEAIPSPIHLLQWPFYTEIYWITVHLGGFSFLSSTVSVETDKPVESIRFAIWATRLHFLLTLKREQIYRSMISRGQTRDLQNVSHEERFREEVKALPRNTPAHPWQIFRWQKRKDLRQQILGKCHWKSCLSWPVSMTGSLCLKKFAAMKLNKVYFPAFDVCTSCTWLAKLPNMFHVLGLQSCRTFSSDCDQKIITGLQLSFRALLLDLYRDSVPSLYGTINPIAPSGASKQKRLTWPLPLRPGKFDADPDQQASADMYWSFFSPSLLTETNWNRQKSRMIV